MSGHYLMPSLGSGMTSGRVLEWYVKPGQAVHRGEVIGLVDTDKGAIEIEVWEDAEVTEILAPPGTTADVGTPLLALSPPGTAEPVTDAPSEIAAGPSRPKAKTPAPKRPPGPRARKVRVTPVARKRAEELGLDPESLTGTGPGGAVSLADVDAAAGTPEGAPAEPSDAVAKPAAAVEAPVAPSADEGDRHRAMRHAIAAAMTRSKREIPHYYLATSVSVERALDWIEKTNVDRAPADRILTAALHLKAVARALEEYPELNGFWENDSLRMADAVHPGLAISLRGGGLVAPAIHDVLARSLDEISAAIRDVVQRARAGRLRGSEVTDATVTVTSLGDRGVETVFGVIYPPQVAIVGVGRALERPWAESGMLDVRRVVQLTLAADHRASDGHRGGLFLERVAELLQTPESL
ncbi:MAG: dihydrolipoamide acetyltransferase family protein [Gemmatimonadota bacterium]